ncbi:hypothetical protein DHEL01_v212432 [Diaporthe helianthi]|uniref:Uncharacterized protein n=1 Tax=Diaporthe helianthi TaxID=158607 RepID=A0A2P5HFZ8_DIAHE|nr:hypothetical protein DHEL01_v212432 [Diaporthe helianthi]
MDTETDVDHDPSVMLGDYFQVEDMTRQAEQDLSARCQHWRVFSATVDKSNCGTFFLVDVERAIRQAWREDLASGPLLREELTKLCLDFAPYLSHQHSFSALLEEVPGFSIAFLQKALGCITSSLRLPISPGSPGSPDSQSIIEGESQNESYDIYSDEEVESELE